MSCSQPRPLHSPRHATPGRPAAVAEALNIGADSLAFVDDQPFERDTTGRTYSYEELDTFRTSGDHLLLVARLTDRYGPYGNIGLTLVETVARAGGSSCCSCRAG